MTTVLDATPRTEAVPDRRTTSWGWPFGLTLALGALTGAAFIGRGSLYLDETVSSWLAVSPWHTFTTTVVHREPNMALYYLLLRGWAHLGHSEAALRSLSLLASVLALAVVMLVTKGLFGARTALICGALLAVDPLVVEFAQDVRGYALSLLLVSASSALFVRGIVRRAGWVTWAGYVVLGALAAYANFWAALVPLAHYASLAFLRRGEAPVRRLVACAVAFAVALVPLGLMIRAADSAGVNWAAGTSAGRLFSRARAAVPHGVLDVAVVLAAAVLVALVVVLRRRYGAFFFEHWPLMFVACWLVVPIVAVVLLSFVYKPLLVLRYLVVCLPPAVMLVAVALARVKARVLGLAMGVLLAASGAGLWQWYVHGFGEDWRAATTAVAERAAPGDGVVVFAPYMRIPFDWYLLDHPAAQAGLRPVFPGLGLGSDPLVLDTNVPVREAAVTLAARGHAHVWLVLSQETFAPAQERAVVGGLRAAGLSARRTLAFSGIDVVEYAASGGGDR